MKRLLLGGAAGTTVMTFMMYFVRPKLVGKPMDIAAEIANQIGGNWWLGMTVHVMIGVVILPLLFSFVFARFLPGPSVLKGLLVGVGFWLLTMTVTMPSMGKGYFLTATGEGPKAIVAAFMAHAVYGILLGKIAALKSDDSQSATPSA
ncbi:MAG: DUF6789 family protein [Fuerstiella sp.]